MNEVPNAIEAERTVLGMIYLDGIVGMEKCLQLRKEHFYLSSHRELFEVFQELLQETPIPDATAVLGALGSRLEAVGGAAYIAGLTEGLYNNFVPGACIAAILESWRRREGIRICASVSAELENPDTDPTDSLAYLQEASQGILEDAKPDDPHVKAYTELEYERLVQDAFVKDNIGLSYGLRELDDRTNGMQPGEVTVVGARSGVGKSSLMKQAAMANCSKGIGVDLYSLEMSRRQILRGIWAAMARIPAYKVLMRPNLLMPSERESLRAVAHQVAKWPLRIYDNAEISLEQIVAYARASVRRHGTKLIVVDYAQNVQAEGKDERTKVANVSRKLTKMVKGTDASLMLLSQLRKVPHEQYNNAPTISDLRETGQLENDAHVVLLLHRGYDDIECKVSNETAIIIPKFRSGQTGAIRATFNTNTLAFE